MPNILLCPDVEPEWQEKTQCIVPNVSGKAFTFSPVKCDDSCGIFLKIHFYQVNKISFYSNLLIL